MKCLTCGKTADSEYCFLHKPRKQLLSTRGLQSPALAKKFKANVGKSQPNKNHILFKKIWGERSHVSEISGDFLGTEALSSYFHHILPKNKYPEGRMDEENIILLTINEHANVEADIYRYQKINDIRKYLLNKHKLE